MMGSTHALSGGVAWLAGCAAVHTLGGTLDPTMVLVGTPVAAGWALWPDLDHPDSTLTHRGGDAGRVLSDTVAVVALQLHHVTRTVWDRPARTGHRLLTHCAAWAALTGIVVAGATRLLGVIAAGVLVFCATHLGTQVTLPWRLRRIRVRVRRLGRWVNVSVPLVVATLATGAVVLTGPGVGWWLGLAAAVGSLTHVAGDVGNGNGCPVWGLIPVPVLRRTPHGWRLLGWRMWAQVRMPAKITIRFPWRTVTLPGRLTLNGSGERWVVRPALAVTGSVLLTAMTWTVSPTLATRAGGAFMDLWRSVVG